MAVQTMLPLGKGWGGVREGAGRKPGKGRSKVPHVRRPTHRRRHPLHVTVRVRSGLPSLREQSLFLCIRREIAAAKRRFMRIVHFSVQSNHVHLLIEASDRGSLSRGMKGLGVRVARNLNQLLRSRGSVWGDRYHARALATPREVRNALVYVLFNRDKHAGAYAEAASDFSIRSRRPSDPCSSAAFFDGWTEARTAVQRAPPQDSPVVRAETWLLGTGWRRLGGHRSNAHVGTTQSWAPGLGGHARRG